MNQIFMISILIIALNLFLAVQSACTIDDVTTTNLDCTSSTGRTFKLNTLPNFPASGTTEVSISFAAMLTYYCSASDPFNYLTLVQTLSSGGPFTVTSWLSSGNFGTSTTQESSSLPIVSGGQVEYVQFTISLQLSSTDTLVTIGVVTGDDWLYKEYHDNSMTSSLATLGADTTLHLCSDSSGSNIIGCSFLFLKVVYGYFQSTYLLEMSPLLLSYYKMYEGTGYTLVNSRSGSVGSAYLGTSSAGNPNTATSPTWTLNADNGLTFMSPYGNQLVTLGLFTFSRSTLLVKFSFTLQTWIKVTLDSYFGSSAYLNIFRIVGTSTNNELLSLQYLNDGSLWLSITGTGVSQLNGPTLSADVWTSLSFSMASFGNGTYLLYQYSLDSTISEPQRLTLNSPFTLPSSYYCTIGGGSRSMRGQVGSFQLFSPGTLTYQQSTSSCYDATTCIVDVGLTLQPTCLQYPSSSCDSSCSVCSTTSANGCIRCASSSNVVQNGYCQCTFGNYYTGTGSSCSACTITDCAACLGASTCQACVTGEYPNSNVCTSCTSPCQNCANTANSCTSCITGYGLTSTASCTQCGSGQYVDTYGICASCESPCGECDVSATNCTSCASGYSFNGTNSCGCPAGQYDDGSLTCQTCDFPCGNCTGTATTCTSCASSYTFESSSNTCVCGAGTYETGSSCASCTSPCGNCTGSATTCTSCASNYTFVSSSNTCACVAGEYDSGSDCQSCTSPCGNCTGTATNCTSCASGYQLETDNTCRSTLCPGGQYYYSDGSCKTYCNAPYTPSQDSTTGILYCDVCTKSNTAISTNDGASTTLYYYPSDGICRYICDTPYYVKTQGTLNHCQLPLSTEELAQVQSTSASANTVGQVMTGSIVAASVFMPTDPNGISSGSLSKLFEYSRYLPVTRSAKLEQFYADKRATPGTVTIGPDLPDHVKTEVPYHPVAPIMTINNLHSNFFVNFFTNMESLLIISGGVLAVLGGEILMKKHLNPLLVYYIKLRIAVIGFLTMQFYNVYAEIMLYCVIEFQTFKSTDGYDWLGLFIAVLFLGLGILVLFWHARMLKRYQTTKAQVAPEELTKKKIEQFQKNHENFPSLYKDFKDTSFLCQSYLWLISVRTLISTLLLSTLYDHPIPQIILITSLTIGMIIFLILKFPQKDIFAVLQQLAFELDFLILDTCFIIMAFLDYNESTNEDLRDTLGDIVIESIFASKFLPMISLVPKVSKMLMDVIKQKINERKERMKAIERKREKAKAKAEAKAKKQGIAVEPESGRPQTPSLMTPTSRTGRSLDGLKSPGTCDNAGESPFAKPTSSFVRNSLARSAISIEELKSPGTHEKADEIPINNMAEELEELKVINLSHNELEPDRRIEQEEEKDDQTMSPIIKLDVHEQLIQKSDNGIGSPIDPKPRFTRAYNSKATTNKFDSYV